MNKAPVFVKIKDYNDLVKTLEQSQNKLEQAKAVLAKITDVKTREDELIKQWAEDIQNVEERLQAIQETLTPPHE